MHEGPIFHNKKVPYPLGRLRQNEKIFLPWINTRKSMYSYITLLPYVCQQQYNTHNTIQYKNDLYNIHRVTHLKFNFISPNYGFIHELFLPHTECIQNFAKTLQKAGKLTKNQGKGGKVETLTTFYSNNIS